MKIKLTVNGLVYERECAEHRTLLRFLREDLGLTGTKEGCGMGECGACTVILNGQAVNSCMVLAVEADGAVINTIEGEASGPVALGHPDRPSRRNHAVQCGFCTPGMVMSVKELLAEQAQADASTRSRKPSKAISAAAPATPRSSRPSWT